MKVSGYCKDCGGDVQSNWFARELCSKHYKAWRRREGLYGPRYVSPHKCCIEGCDKPRDSHGMCTTHSRRVDRHGDPGVVLRHPIPDACSVPGCDKPMVQGSGRGLCPMHYQRWRVYGDVNHATVRTDLLDRTAPCSTPGCGQPIGPRGNKGMCRGCARRAQRARRPDHYKAKLNARRSRVRLATPPWADLAAIEAFYAGCPAGHEVDHVVPLQGRRVCGLHIAYNLQYLPVAANRRKGNVL